MASSNTTSISPPRVPMVDTKTGLISREWYRFFLNLFESSGGGEPTPSIPELQIGPPSLVLSDLVFPDDLSPPVQLNMSLPDDLSPPVQLSMSLPDDLSPPVQLSMSLPDDLSPSSVQSEVTQLSSQIQNLLLNPDYFSSQIMQLANEVVSLEFNRQYVDTLHLHYARFYDTTTHTAAATNTAYALTIDTTVYNLGIEIGATTSRIYVVNPGAYNFEINFQFAKSNSAHNNAWVWFRKNGTDIAYSVTKYDLTGAGSFFKNLLVTLAAQDYIEVAWAVDDTSISIAPVASTAFSPTGPSISITVTEATI